MTANVIKFQAPFERLKLAKSSPDTMLLKAIILQAIIDASNISTNGKLKRYEIEAKSWIFGRSEYFVQICEEAGMEADFVIRIAKEVIKLQKSKASLKTKNKRKPHENQWDHLRKCYI